eukprot:INCI9944.1.p1 GENE.INCI9944.1~~INCI9944.1.p1  ORF type:complete len:1064 (-),score=136.31 INCI9944.1:251-3442(-)
MVKPRRLLLWWTTVAALLSAHLISPSSSFVGNVSSGGVKDVLYNDEDGAMVVEMSSGQRLTQAEICATDHSRKDFLQFLWDHNPFEPRTCCVQASHSPEDVLGDLKCMWVSTCEDHIGQPPKASSLDARFQSRDVFIGLKTSHCRCPDGWAVMRSDSGCCVSDPIVHSTFSTASTRASNRAVPSFLRAVSTDGSQFDCNPVCLDTAVARPACGPASSIRGTAEDPLQAIFEAAYQADRASALTQGICAQQRGVFTSDTSAGPSGAGFLRSQSAVRDHNALQKFGVDNTDGAVQTLSALLDDAGTRMVQTTEDILLCEQNSAVLAEITRQPDRGCGMCMALTDQTRGSVDRSLLGQSGTANADRGLGGQDQAFDHLVTHCVPCGMMALYMQSGYHCDIEAAAARGVCTQLKKALPNANPEFVKRGTTSLAQLVRSLTTDAGRFRFLDDNEPNHPDHLTDLDAHSHEPSGFGSAFQAGQDSSVDVHRQLVMTPALRRWLESTEEALDHASPDEWLREDGYSADREVIRFANPTEAAVADFSAAADTAVRAGRRMEDGSQKVLRPTPLEAEFSREARLEQIERETRGQMLGKSGTGVTDTVSEVGKCRSPEASLFEGSRAAAGAKSAAALASGNDPSATLSTRAINLLDNQRLRQQEHDMYDAFQAAFPTNFELRVKSATMFPRGQMDAVLDAKPVLPIKWREPSKHFFACTDSRIDFAQLGAFGGDVGEFALALAVLEHYRLSEVHSVSARTRYLSKDDVLYLLQSYLEASFDTHDQRLFTHCMDNEALAYLSQRSEVKDPLHPKSQQEVLNILEVCGEADASATEWQAMLLSGAGMVTGARALPRIRAQLMRYVVEAFWTIHFDAAHPMQRRMVVIPLAGSRNDPSGELTLLRIVQPRMGVVDDAAVDGKLASPCDARSAVASPLINPGTRAITRGENSAAGTQGPAVQDAGATSHQTLGLHGSTLHSHTNSPHRGILVYHQTAAHMHRERIAQWLIDSDDVRQYTAGADLVSAKYLVRLWLFKQACTSGTMKHSAMNQVVSFVRSMCTLDFSLNVCALFRLGK